VDWKRFALRIGIPTALALVLFGAFLFGILLPDVERNLLDRKRDTIRELTRSAWSVLKEYEAEEAAGRLTREEAQSAAAARVRDMRYGPEGKDYFWITDMTPRMVMHPFRTDLDGKDVSDFTDPRGHRVFVEFVHRVQEAGSGYVDYVWQWKDDPGRLVSKESFVMGFAPWDWVIGTGIYTEDVRAEIDALTARMVRVALLIVGIVTLILVFVTLQSLRIERQRGAAEAALRASHARYRALVESSTEGTLLVLEGRCAYGNPVLEQMLGREPGALAGTVLLDLLPPAGDDPARRWLEDHLAGRPAPGQFEARLLRADGQALDALVSATRIEMEGRPGVIVTVRDMARTRRAEADGALDRQPELKAALPFGVFRTTAGRRGHLLEANPAARAILGFAEGEDVAGVPLMDRCFDAGDREAVADTLARDAALTDRLLRIRGRDGSPRTVRVAAVMVRDATGHVRHVDGLLEDVTDREAREAGRAALLEDLLAAVRFLEAPVSERAAPAATCALDAPVSRAAAAMARGPHDAVLVEGPGGDAVGIVTDADLRRRVVAESRDPVLPVYQVMSAPVASVPASTPAFEALERMGRLGVRHLLVRDAAGRPAGLASREALLAFDRFSPAVLLRAIATAASPDEVAAARCRLPALVEALVAAGSTARSATRLVTAVSDAVSRRLLELAVADLGPPPARFAFLALGSQGRGEQTLATDQDNALLHEDVAPDRKEAVTSYFQRLGTRVCNDLAAAGYPLCTGDAMARNPKWNAPLSRWRDHFGRWIGAGTPQDLLSVNMFFDFRPVAGDADLALALRRHIDAELAEHPSFFLLFAQDALQYRPPIGMFGKIVTGPGPEPGADRNTFSVKEAALPLVNFARLYALKHAVDRTHTLERLEALHAQGVLTSSSRREITAAYETLVGVRLRHHAAAVARGVPPDNNVDPRDLAETEEAAVRKALGQVATVLKKISFDFLGAA
jgi:PAS domain S-box-containing protein